MFFKKSKEYAAVEAQYKPKLVVKGIWARFIDIVQCGQYWSYEKAREDSEKKLCM
jgi:hypothetical protein